MKFARLTLCALAAVALIAGCGKSSEPTRVTDTGTPTLDNTAPPVPAGLRVTDDLVTGQSTVSWTPSSASDVTGYELYLYSPDPDRESSYTLLFNTDAATSQYPVDPSSDFTTRYYRVRAVDASGNRSAMSSTLTVAVGPAAQAPSHDPDQGPMPRMTP